MEFKKHFKNQNPDNLNHLQKAMRKMVSQQEAIEESVSVLEEELLSIESTCDEITFYLDQLNDHIESLKI